MAKKPAKPTAPAVQPRVEAAIPAGATIIAIAPAQGELRGFVSSAGTVVGFAPPNGTVLGFAPPNGTVLGMVGSEALRVSLLPPDAQPDAAAEAVLPGGDGKHILAWEDDPGSRIVVRRPAPVPAATAMIAIEGKPPKPGEYRPGTAGFRYWTAAEALERAAGFWRSVVPDLAWRTGPTLPVKLNAGSDLNAYYDRTSLSFFEAMTGFGPVYSGESPDVVCHELGHAVLDHLKPELWNAASHEAAAFHEAFGDISALLAALQLRSMRVALLEETHGRVYASSRLSRLAEQLGAAIRLTSPQSVEPDCLRNAVNNFTYADPIGLPHLAPAGQLSSEPHSFSRVFSGTFLEVVAALFHNSRKRAPQPNQADLAAAASKAATLLVGAIRRAPVVSNFFAQVAAEMVLLARDGGDPAMAGLLRGVFARRLLLSYQAGSDSHQPYPNSAGAGMTGGHDYGSLGKVAIDAGHLGFNRPIVADSPSHARRFAVNALAPDGVDIEPASAMTATRGFTTDLVRRGRVAPVALGRARPVLDFGRRFATHELVADGGSLLLRRRCLDCGLSGD